MKHLLQLYSPGENRGYSYDAAWNLSSRNANGDVSAFAVDVKNQLTSQPDGSCSYDANGNLTNNAGQLMAYDCENRLVSWAAGAAAPGVRGTAFYYDGLGRLRTRAEYLHIGSSWILQKTVNYVYDGMRVIQERDSYNNPSVTYTRGIDLSGTMEGAGGIGGLLSRSIYFPQCSTNLTVRINNNTPDTLTGVTIYDSYNSYVSDQTIDPYTAADFSFEGVGGNNYTIFGYGDYYFLPYVGETFVPILDFHEYEANFDEPHHSNSGTVLCGADSTTMVNYYFCDGNGNITYMMDGAQNMVAQYRYDPFGNIIGQDGPLADHNVYRFSSKEYMPGSGLYCYGYRFYSPQLQRWINRDPIQERGGINLFCFLQNSAVATVDPVGLRLWYCTTPTTMLKGLGRHGYIWNDDPNIPTSERECGQERCSGTRGPAGSNNNGPVRNGSTGGNYDQGGNWHGAQADRGDQRSIECSPILGAEDDLTNQLFMRGCRAGIDNNPWVPFVWDCHTSARGCLREAGFNPPRFRRWNYQPEFGPATPLPPLLSPKDQASK